MEKVLTKTQKRNLQRRRAAKAFKVIVEQVVVVPDYAGYLKLYESYKDVVGISLDKPVSSIRYNQSLRSLVYLGTKIHTVIEERSD
jgi:hypothetical protein